MWLDGKHSRTIAKVINCAEGYVRRVARELNLPMRQSRQNAMGAMFDDYIIKFHNQKMTLLVQSERIGVSVDFIKKRRRILGLSIPKGKKQ